MRNLRKKPWRKTGSRGLERYARFLILLVAAILLLLVIVLLDKPSKEAGSDPVTTAQSTEEPDTTVPDTSAVETDQSGEESETESPAAYTPGQELKQDEMQELTDLVWAYCHAKEDSDPTALDRVFGRESGSEEEQEAEKIDMERTGRMVDGYENVTCYYMDGMEEDTYVLYPYFDIRYKDAQMLMPSLTWVYAVKGEDGQFYMTQDISSSEEAFVAETGRTEAVRALIDQVNEKKAEALAGDEALRRIYDEDGVYNDGNSSMVEIVAPSIEADVTPETQAQTPEAS